MKTEALIARLPVLPQRLLIGLSGGADSMALTQLLAALPDKQLTAVHVNHGLRGDAADGDEAFVRAFCQTKGMPLLCYRAHPPLHASEGWAREVRYGFYQEAMAESGAEALVLAHHQEDQAETVLLHLMRGAGLQGLSAMRQDTVIEGMRVLRPLLGFSRGELRQVLAEAGQAWREDATNAEALYLRNALRLQVLPLLEQLQTGAVRHIAQTAMMAGEAQDTLRALASQFLTENAGETWLSLSPLIHQPKGLQQEILRLWWANAHPQTLDRSQTEALLHLIHQKAGSKCNLPKRWTAYRGWTHLHLLRPTASPVEGEVPAISGTVRNGVEMQVGPLHQEVGDGKGMQAIPESLLSQCVLRTRRAGDWIRPFGSEGKQSLQDYLVNQKIDAPFRGQIPLLCRGSEVLLVAGVGAGAIPAMQPNENTGLCLIWSGSMPWKREKEKNHGNDRKDV